jgi:hypothetical protein
LHRRVRQGHRTIPQVLIQWCGTDASNATWEDLDLLRQQFPRSTAWGEAGTQEGEIPNGANSNSNTGPAAQPRREAKLPARLAGRERVH